MIRTLTRTSIVRGFACFTACISLVACEKKFNPADGDPPAAQVIQAGDMSLVSVDKPNLFPLATAERTDAVAELRVTGTVNPDISREIPVISLVSGRVVEIQARLGDTVKKGQLLLKVQSPDSTNALNTYLKAVNDERLSQKAYTRAKDLYDHGATSLGALEQAETAERDMQADLAAADEQLKTLGVDKNHPSSIVGVYAPISGVVIGQNVTNAAAAGMTFAGSATTFTIADLSTVWILCDVYENDLPKIAVGQSAHIRANAYPDRELTGKISDIQPILDPNLRTAKVRIEVTNPGILKVGMFVTASFESKTKEVRAAVPATAVLHLHDRDWVFMPAGDKSFKRVEVHTGAMLPGNRQEILSGIVAGQQVVSNVLQLESTLEAQ